MLLDLHQKKQIINTNISVNMLIVELLTFS
jgi:hypothetical protein